MATIVSIKKYFESKGFIFFDWTKYCKELFSIEKITVLGEISDEFKDKLKQMSSPVVKSYVGGIRQE